MDLQEAEIKYPVPEFVNWYFFHFPKKQFIIAGVILFATGFVATIFNLQRIFVTLPTYLFCGLLLIGSVLHVSAWYMMRSTLKKRAKFLNLSFKEYLQLLEYGD